MGKMGETQFPEVQGGGSLILAWQIRNKRVLVVGGGEVAAGRILNVLNADAKVTVVSPREGLNPAVADPEASSQIWKLCKERKIAANIADVPPECDFYFGSVHRDGPLQIMVSTNGKGPRFANIVRRSIAEQLPANTGEAITEVGKLRQMLRKVAPGIEEGPKRMAWMIKVSDAYSLEDLCAMDEKDMETLLRFYAPDQVPRYGCLKAMEGELDAFDGSFGFCVGWG